jgi:hypothetical protein
MLHQPFGGGRPCDFAKQVCGGCIFQWLHKSSCEPDFITLSILKKPAAAGESFWDSMG